jgi:hypothetical protein
MPGELIPRDEFGSADRGSYHIPYSRLIELYNYDQSMRAINYALMALIDANPEFEFLTEDDFIDHGITIRWRRRKNASLARERDVLSERVRPSEHPDQ